MSSREIQTVCRVPSANLPNSVRCQFNYFQLKTAAMTFRVEVNFAAQTSNWRNRFHRHRVGNSVEPLTGIVVTLNILDADAALESHNFGEQQNGVERESGIDTDIVSC